MSKPLERVISAVIAASALSVAVAVVHREFSPSNEASDSQRSGMNSEPTLISGWDSVLASGIKMTPRGIVTLVEFVDFECPVCRAFSGVLEEAKSELGDTLGVVLVHYPLTQHRFARLAARAAECSERFGRFPEYHDLLFAKQDSFGLKSWASYAFEAGVVDTTAFKNCVEEKQEIPRVNAGVGQGKRIGVLGTPTILLDGWRFWSTPTAEELKTAVRRVAMGMKPST